VIEEAVDNHGKTRATASTLEKQAIALATRPTQPPAVARAGVRFFRISAQPAQDRGRFNDQNNRTGGLAVTCARQTHSLSVQNLEKVTF
jgi:hypothetical protein